MSENGVVAYPTIFGWSGSFVMHNPRPDHLGEEVRKILCREGDMITIDVLCDQHRYWLDVSSEANAENEIQYQYASKHGGHIIDGFGIKPNASVHFTRFAHFTNVSSVAVENEPSWAYVIFYDQIAIWRFVSSQWHKICMHPAGKPIDEGIARYIDSKVEEIA